MSSGRITRSRKRKMVDENLAQEARQLRSLEQIKSLIDDCWLEVFSYLSEMDLCAVKKSHSRFQHVADDAFKRKFVPPIAAGGYTVNGDRDFKETAEILKNFGHKIGGVSMRFGSGDRKCKCKYILLLKHCTNLYHLRIMNTDFDDLSIDPMDIKAFWNLRGLYLHECTGTEKYFEEYLSKACDPSKLRVLYLCCSSTEQISVELLASVVDRFVNIGILGIDLHATTTLSRQLLKNLSKLKNLKRLTKLLIRWDNEPTFDATAMQSLPATENSILNEAVVKMTNTLWCVREIIFRAKRKIPDSLIEKMSKSRKMIYKRCLHDNFTHEYTLER